jgi:hypothetical protein
VAPHGFEEKGEKKRNLKNNPCQKLSFLVVHQTSNNVMNNTEKNI